MFTPPTIGPGLLISGEDWRGVERPQLDLSLMDFDQVDLRGSKLDQLIARGSCFYACAFDGSTLRKAVITRWFGDFKIEPHNLLSAPPKLADGSKWDLSEFELVEGDEEAYGQLATHRWTRSADLTACSLRGVDASGVRLEGVSIYECDFSGANLAGATLSGARLSVVDFSGAVLTGVDFSNVMLDEVNFSGAVGAP